MIRQRALQVLALLVTISTPVYPCGGPESYHVDAPLLKSDRYLAAIELTDDFDARRRNELRFLAPFLDTRSPGIDALWLSAYSDATWSQPAGLDTTATFGIEAVVSGFTAAGERGDIEGLRVSARGVVGRLLDVPAVVADEHQVALRRAVEVLESSERLQDVPPAALRALYSGDSASAEPGAGLPPFARELLEFRSVPRDSMGAWASAHPGTPRLPSARFVAVQLAMQQGIPDGYATSIRDSVPPARWKELERLHAQWLDAYPTHPLAEWMRLSRLRLAFFSGDAAAAWNVALDVYGRHPVRALAEMRYLLQQSVLPPSLDDPRIDPTLRAALLSDVAVTRTQWAAWWRGAEGSSEPWARRVRERLLWQVARDTSGTWRPLPEGYPASPRGLTPLAGAFRLIALAREGRTAEAIEQADSLGGDSAVAPIRAHVLLTARRWRDALAVPLLPLEAKQYLVRVMAPDSVLQQVLGGGDGTLARDAARTLAARAVGRDGWGAAARLLPAEDAARAADWGRAQKLSEDSTLTGRLTYARWLRERNGRLLFGGDKVWYRSINWRMWALDDSVGAGDFDAALPWTAADEREAIGRHFDENFEMYLALREYADWLARAPANDGRRRAVVREADAAYNWLVNWDANNSRYWQRELERRGVGAAIRRAGRRR